MIAPHGGKLVNRHADSESHEKGTDTRAFPKIRLTLEQAKTVENISTGVYSPLCGFMTSGTLEKVLTDCRLQDGTAWTLPVLLPVPDHTAEQLKHADQAALYFEDELIGVLEIADVFQIDKAKLVRSVYGTEDPRHPGVQKVMHYGEWFAGGDIWAFRYVKSGFPDYKFTPQQTRTMFEARGWHTVAAFQTRNAPHLGHEYVQKSALTFSDGLFIQPVLGKKKTGDFTDEAIVRSYQALIDHYYRKDNTLLSVLEYEMEYAGPKEAIHHAIMRKNFGCTHMIIGRDHAGVGNFYSPYAAQEIFREFPDLEIQPIILNSFFFCKKCEAIANEKTCPHPQCDHVDFSGTKIRKFFTSGDGDLTGLMRPEVVREIMNIPNRFVD